MNTIKSLVWKEWCETRIYLFIGLGIFLGLPFIQAIEDHARHHLTIEASVWVGPFGGVLAIFVAVGSTCRDLQGRVEDFWRSRPVSTTRWLVVKYIVALLVALTACIVPILVEGLTTDKVTGELPGGNSLLAFPFVLTAVFSVSFAAGCLLRRTAHAAMAGIAAMLLIYFLPFVLPFLSWMNVFETESGIPEIVLLIGMLLISRTSLFVAITALKRNWFIESGQRTMYSAISFAILLLCSSVAFQLGSNLTELSQTPLPAGELLSTLFRETDGSIYASTYYNAELNNTVRPYHYRKIKVGNSKIEIGDQENNVPQNVAGALLSDGKEIWYETGAFDQAKAESRGGPWAMYIVRPVRRNFLPAFHVKLHIWDEDEYSDSYSFVYAAGDKLYCFGVPMVSGYGYVSHRLAVVDISDLEHPRLVKSGPLIFNFDMGVEPSRDDDWQIPLPRIAGLGQEDLLKIALHFDREHALDDGILCCRNRYRSLAEYRLKSSSAGDMAKLEKVGEYKATWLQKVFGTFASGNLRISNGLLYQMEYSSGLISSSISVYELRSAHPMRLVGHFAAPGIRFIEPMADGRLLLGGDQFWLVQPPMHNEK